MSLKEKREKYLGIETQTRKPSEDRCRDEGNAGINQGASLIAWGQFCALAWV